MSDELEVRTGNGRWRTLNLSKVAEVLQGVKSLSSGSHDGPNEGMCVMEAVSWATGGRWTDVPGCVSVVVSHIAQGYNDSSVWDSDIDTDEMADRKRREGLLPFALRTVGTRGSSVEEWARNGRVLHWLVTELVAPNLAELYRMYRAEDCHEAVLLQTSTTLKSMPVPVTEEQVRCSAKVAHTALRTAEVSLSTLLHDLNAKLGLRAMGEELGETITHIIHLLAVSSGGVDADFIHRYSRAALEAALEPVK